MLSAIFFFVSNVLFLLVDVTIFRQKVLEQLLTWKC